MMEAIEACLETAKDDEATVAALVPRLIHLIRRGVGLPTRVRIRGSSPACPT